MAGGIFQNKDFKFKASLSYIRPYRKNNSDKKTQWVKVLAKQLCKPCNLRLIPGTHIKVEEENQLQSCSLTSPCLGVRARA